jgi:hypothetical protein
MTASVFGLSLLNPAAESTTLFTAFKAFLMPECLSTTSTPRRSKGNISVLTAPNALFAGIEQTRRAFKP